MKARWTTVAGEVARLISRALVVAWCAAAPVWARDLKMDFESSKYAAGGLDKQDGWQDYRGIHKILTGGVLAGKQSLQIGQPPAPISHDQYARSGEEYAYRALPGSGKVEQWSMVVKPTSAGEFHARFDAGSNGTPNVAGVYLDTRPTVRQARGTEGEKLGGKGDIEAGKTYRVTLTFNFDAGNYTVTIQGVGNRTAISGTCPFRSGSQAGGGRLTPAQAAAGAILFRNCYLPDFDGQSLVDDIVVGRKP